MAVIYRFTGGPANGTAKADQIYGSSFADIIYGLGGDDTIDAGGGNDTIIGGGGADRIDGGTGIDTISFADSPLSATGWFGIDGVWIDLQQGVGLFNDAQGDTYTNIENVTGSAGRDMIGGNAGNNVINGLDGDDVIAGMQGADTMNGGTGNNTLSYVRVGATEGVSVDLATGAASGGDAQGDVFYKFQNLIGSLVNDTLRGNSGANNISAQDGNDLVDGRDGDDVLDGGGGNDTIIGGQGSDRINGGADHDRMSGGTGADTFLFDLAATGPIGSDLIVDFQVGIDQLEFNVIDGIDGLSQLNITQVGGDTFITYDFNEGSVRLVGVDANALLAAGDFTFV
jgi:Ca2+-binding RTX toxin-like protein